MHLTVDPKNAVKWFSKLEFKSANFIDGLYLIQTHKTSIIYDKPCFVGCSILDLSKVRMMDFHYNTIQKNFQGKYDLLYSDTDSMVYQIKIKNFYKWMLEKYYGLEVADLYLVILHPDNPSYRRMRLNILEDEVEDMMECRRRAVELGCKQSVILPIPEDPADEPKEKELASFSFRF